MLEQRNLLLVFGALLVAVALFELGIRHVGLDYNLSPNWRYHPVLGWSQVPGGSYDVDIDGRRVQVQFNALGFRDREHRREKPPGVKRIVVIGDSFCEAVQVNLAETFYERLGHMLTARGPETWEVINLGVGDFGPAQAYVALTEYGLAFDPDVVVQQIFPLNDICNDSLGLYGLCKSKNDRYRPYFVESGGELRRTAAQPIREFLRRHLVTYRLIEYWLLELEGFDPQDPSDPDRRQRLRAGGFDGLDPLLLTYVAADAQPPAVAEGWRVTERLVERIVSLTRERGIAYVGLVVPFERVVGPAWEDFARRQPPPPMVRDYPERRLSALFGRLGVGSVMLLDVFPSDAPETLYVGGHLSAIGHHLAAEALYRVLLEQGVVAPGAPDSLP